MFERSRSARIRHGPTVIRRLTSRGYAAPVPLKRTGSLRRIASRTALEPRERAALADLLLRLGPDAATLCTGWHTRDLAAHLVLRESHPFAAAGIALPLLRRYTDRVQARLAAGDFPALVERLRAGPPRWSPLAWPALREAANGIEFFVHHEDVRRAQPEWQPRDLGDDVEEVLWVRLRRIARLVLRGDAVELRRAGTAEQIVIGRRPPRRIVIGRPSELVLYVFGRRAHARVDEQ